MDFVKSTNGFCKIYVKSCKDHFFQCLPYFTILYQKAKNKLHVFPFKNPILTSHFSYCIINTENTIENAAFLKMGENGLDTSETTKETLIQLFRNILNLEEKAIITEEFHDISNNDMHIIEVIGKDSAKNMSAIARNLSVTVGTLTIAMNNLVKKGYVQRSRSEQDRRVVLIRLTSKGKRAFEHQEQFHHDMMEATLKGLDDSQTQVLLHAMTNLNHFFQECEKEHRKH